MNKEQELTFGGCSLVDEVNHVYPCLVVYMCFDVCYFFMFLDVLVNLFICYDINRGVTLL